MISPRGALILALPCTLLGLVGTSAPAGAQPGPMQGGFSAATCLTGDAALTPLDLGAQAQRMVVAGSTSGEAGDDGAATTLDWSLNPGASLPISTEGDDVITAVDVRQNGTAVIGTTTGTFEGAEAAGGIDGFVAFFDAEGVESWRTQFGTEGDDVPAAVALHDGTVYVVGRTTGESGTQFTVNTFATFSGAPLDERRWGPASVLGLTSVAALDSVLVVGGASQGKKADAYLAALDYDSLDTVWTKKYATTGQDLITGLAAKGNNLYATGYRQGKNGQFVARLTAARKQKWLTTQSNGEGVALSTDIAVTSAGPVVVGAAYGKVGSTNGAPGTADAYAQSFTSDGDIRWTMRFGTPGGAEQFVGVGAQGRHIAVSGTTEVEGCTAFVGILDDRWVDVQVRAIGGYGDNGFAPVVRGTEVQRSMKITNRGTADDILGARVCRPAKGVSVRVFRGTKNVTKQVRNGTYRTGVMAPGATQILTLRIKARPKARIGKRVCRVKAFSASASGTTNVAKLTIGVRKKK